MSNSTQLFPRLWQRVFMYAILLVFASHLVSFAMFRFGIANNMHMQMLDDLVVSATSALEGRSREAAKILPEFFQHHSRTLWIEGADGERIAGEVKPGLSRAERQNLPLIRTNGTARYMTTGDNDAPYLVAAPVSLLDGNAVLYLFVEKMPPPPMSILFLQGFIAVCLIGGALSIWAAWRIARPLRKLRSEVLEIASGNLGARVTVKGSEEICEVADAVNSMAQNLSNNIMGMRELVANISHEMRSPLARMSISVAIIEEGVRNLSRWYAKNPPPETDAAPPVITDAAGSPLAARHVERMAQEIEHMERLVGSCLLNSKLDLQQEETVVEAVDLSLLCKSILPRYEAMMQAKNLSFNRTVQEGLWVDGDEELLGLVLTNLLDNAVKYTADGGVVRLHLREEQTRVLLSLENSHDALDEAELPRLFEPFFRRLDNAGNTAGVGLGLSLVNKITTCHRGRVTAENGEIGLLFTVSLPCNGRSPNPEFVQWFFARHSEPLSMQS
ncbi:MAG: Adaptive-response sensory-kinase SasA [Desulfovibrio sp.]